MKPTGFFDPALCWQITLTLLHVGWLGAAVAGLALAGNWRLRQASASARYWANFAALLVLGLCLPATFVWVRCTDPQPPGAALPAVAPATSAEAKADVPASGVASPGHPASPVSPSVPPAAQRPAFRPGSVALSPQPRESQANPARFWSAAHWLSPYIAAVYALGVAAMLLKLLLGIHGGRRLRAACRAVTDSRLLEVVVQQAARLGLRLAPALACCERVAVPVVIGVLRPMIALPASMIAGLPPEELSAVLTHELAHLRRYDHLLILIQRVVEALLFFHPAIWYLSRQIHLERENCCDDLALATGIDRLVLAGSLLRIAEISLTHAAGCGALGSLAADGRNPSRLRRRIARLLGAVEEPQVRLRRSGLLAAGVAFLILGVLIAPLLSGPAKAPPSAAPAASPKPSTSPAAESPDPSAVRWPWQVVDLDTGQPLAGVAIVARLRKPSELGSSSNFMSPELLDTLELRSGADGRFSLILPGRLRRFSSTLVKVSGTLVGYAAGEAWDQYEFRPHETTLKAATLRLTKGAPLSGRILNPDGTAAAHLRMQCSTTFLGPAPRQTRMGAWTTGYSDSDGRFQLAVPARGECTIFLRPPRALRAAEAVGKLRFNIGDLRLESGLVARGRVLDGAGNPLPYVSVSVRPVGGNDGDFRAITDARGRFELPPQLSGEYWVHPVPDLEITGQSRPEELPPPYRKLILPEDDICVEQPLPAVFRDQKVSLYGGQPAGEVTLKAIPHARLTARFVDRQGQPAPVFAWRAVGGWLDGQLWGGRFDLVPGTLDHLTALVPRGMQNLFVHSDRMNWQLPSPATAKTAWWWRWTPASDRLPGDDIQLHEIDRDYPNIIVERVPSASLEIRLRTQRGDLPKQTQVEIQQARYRRKLEPASPGVYCTDFGILPGRDITVLVTAPGFRSISTRPLRFTEEGQPGLVELTLEPTNATDVPVTLRAPDGQPIVPAVPAKALEPALSIRCRAVDAVTGKPVHDATVHFEVRLLRDATGQPMYRQLESSTTRTDREGRFTVSVPREYLADQDPQRSVDLFVKVSHPQYAMGLGFGNPRQLDNEDLPTNFADFRLVKLEPGREIHGRVLDPAGRPVSQVPIYKFYSPTQASDADNPISTDQQGRFRTMIPARIAPILEVRAGSFAEYYYAVPTDRADLGDLRLSEGVRVTGRVVDSQGQPVRRMTVTVPSFSKPANQPDASYQTDNAGRFHTSKLAPGKYVMTPLGVADADPPALLHTADAAGVFVPQPLEIRAGQPVAEPTLRPVADVRCTAALINTRPAPSPDDKPPPAKSNADQWKLLAEAMVDTPILTVEGRYQGYAWTGTTFGSMVSYNSAEALSTSTSAGPPQCTLRVPQGLTDATLRFGFLQHFQLDATSPKLFGAGMHLARIDHDLTGITLYRYREATLNVHVDAGGKPLPGDVQVQARYAREKAMRAAGAVFDDAQPLLKRQGIGSDVSYVVLLPAEDIEVSAAAPRMNPAVAHVQLKDGETRELVVHLVPSK